MRPVLQMSHIAWSVCISVCVLGIHVSCAKTAGPIKMPFGEQVHVIPRKHILDGDPDPSREGEHCNVLTHK